MGGLRVDDAWRIDEFKPKDATKRVAGAAPCTFARPSLISMQEVANHRQAAGMNACSRDSPTQTCSPGRVHAPHVTPSVHLPGVAVYPLLSSWCEPKNLRATMAPTASATPGRSKRGIPYYGRSTPGTAQNLPHRPRDSLSNIARIYASIHGVSASSASRQGMTLCGYRRRGNS